MPSTALLLYRRANLFHRVHVTGSPGNVPKRALDTWRAGPDHRSFEDSDLAATRMGMSASASFQSVRKSSYLVPNRLTVSSRRVGGVAEENRVGNGMLAGDSEQLAVA